MNTDIAWEQWGQREPYYGVITNDKFRLEKLTEEARHEFFESGRVHAEYVLQMIRQYIDPSFDPHTVMDFGCGVGRLVIPFARFATEVVGVDVSRAMLAEARRNCEKNDLGNVRLMASDDDLSEVPGTFDLIHSYIVFQHIPPDRGRNILRSLTRRLTSGGVGALHFSYSKSHYAGNNGLAPPAVELPVTPAIPGEEVPGGDPEMQMNPYHLNELFFILQQAGISRVHAEFTNHGGELGIFLFFQRL